MDIHSFYENIKSQAEAINVNLNNEMCEQFYYYMKLMLEWNENINLTAIIEEDEIVFIFFFEYFSSISTTNIIKYSFTSQLLSFTKDTNGSSTF